MANTSTNRMMCTRLLVAARSGKGRRQWDRLCSPTWPCHWCHWISSSQHRHHIFEGESNIHSFIHLGSREELLCTMGWVENITRIRDIHSQLLQTCLRNAEAGSTLKGWCRSLRCWHIVFQQKSRRWLSQRHAKSYYQKNQRRHYLLFQVEVPWMMQQSHN